MSIKQTLQMKFIYIFTYVSAGWLGAGLVRDYISRYTANGLIPTIIAIAALVLAGHWMENKFEKELALRFTYIFTYVSAGWLGAGIVKDYILNFTKNGLLPTVVVISVLIVVGYYMEGRVNK